MKWITGLLLLVAWQTGAQAIHRVAASHPVNNTPVNDIRYRQPPGLSFQQLYAWACPEVAETPLYRLRMEYRPATAAKDIFMPLTNAAPTNAPAEPPRLPADPLTGLQWSSETLPFFCRIEHDLGKKTRIPFKFRLGSVEYVDWLEGKPGCSDFAPYR